MGRSDVPHVLWTARILRVRAVVRTVPDQAGESHARYRRLSVGGARLRLHLPKVLKPNVIEGYPIEAGLWHGDLAVGFSSRGECCCRGKPLAVSPVVPAKVVGVGKFELVVTSREAY